MEYFRELWERIEFARRAKAEEREYIEKVTPQQVIFFDTDKNTQDLLRKYTMYVTGKIEADQIQDILHIARTNDALYLYLQHKSRHMDYPDDE